MDRHATSPPRLRSVIAVRRVGPRRHGALSVASEYTPGTPFTVQVGLSPVFNLGLYNVEVVFRTTDPVAGLLSVNAPSAAGSGYVFPTAVNFFGSRLESGNEYRGTLSDFTHAATGSDVVGG